MRSKSDPKRIQARERARQALELRKAGVSYERIADKLGYNSKQAVHKAVKTALKAITTETAEELRLLEDARLDALLLAIWKAAIKGDQKAIDRVLRILERRAKLHGLDAPTKANLASFDYNEADLDKLNPYELERIIAGDDPRSVFAAARSREIREAAQDRGSEGENDS